MVFKHHQLISLGKKQTSNYNGELNIEPKGSHKSGDRLINGKQVQGYTPL